MYVRKLSLGLLFFTCNSLTTSNMSHVVLVAYPMKLNISARNGVTKIRKKSYSVISVDLCPETRIYSTNFHFISTLNFLGSVEGGIVAYKSSEKIKQVL